MRRVACILQVATMFGAIDLVRGEDVPPPPRYATGANAYGTTPSYEDRIQSPPFLDGDERRALLEMARGQDAAQIPTLLKAARYLDEAGLQEEAAKVRALAARRRAEWQALLDEKSAELGKLQADVDALRKALGDARQTQLRETPADGRQVKVHFRILKASRSRLRELGFDWHDECATPIAASESAEKFAQQGVACELNEDLAAPRVVEEGCWLFNAMSRLNHPQVEIVTEHFVTTTNGRKSFFQIQPNDKGATMPEGAAHDKLDKFMIRVEFLPAVQADGSIRLELKARLHDPEDIGAAGAADANCSKAPTRETEIAALLRREQTLVATCPAEHLVFEQADPSTEKSRIEEIEYLILATPIILERTVATAPAAPTDEPTPAPRR